MLRKYINRSRSEPMPDYEHFVTRLPLDIFDNDVANFIVFNQIAGDYLEFGVYRGDGLASFYHRIKKQWESYRHHAEAFGHQFDGTYFDRKRFFAFDSFAGLPQESGANTPAHFGQAGIYAMPQAAFHANLREKAVPDSAIVAVPGYFDQSLTAALREEHQLAQAALIFIDCDLYDSARTVFQFITPLVQTGTVIVLDDYFRYKGASRQGVRGAFNQWLESCPHLSVTELTRVAANRVAFICETGSNSD